VAATATAGPSVDAVPEGALIDAKLPDVGEYHPAVPFEIARVVNPWFDATAEITRVPLGAGTHQAPAATAGITDQAKVKPTASMVRVAIRRTTLISYFP
jgi:hypothetical protein